MFNRTLSFTLIIVVLFTLFLLADAAPLHVRIVVNRVVHNRANHPHHVSGHHARPTLPSTLQDYPSSADTIELEITIPENQTDDLDLHLSMNDDGQVSLDIQTHKTLDHPVLGIYHGKPQSHLALPPPGPVQEEMIVQVQRHIAVDMHHGSPYIHMSESEMPAITRHLGSLPSGSAVLHKEVVEAPEATPSTGKLGLLSAWSGHDYSVL